MSTTAGPVRGLLRTAVADPQELRERGRSERSRVPRRLLAVHVPRDPQIAVRIVEETGRGRLEHLLPLRTGRMAASPFAFLRGSAAVMAHDLACGPRTQLTAQVCGDAHVSNFGFYASPERRLVMDINDFDETARGPFDVDLRRLGASVVVAGREAGATRARTEEAVRDAVRSYRTMLRGLAGMGVLDAWHLRFDEDLLDTIDIEHLSAVLRKATVKAQNNDSRTVAAKWTVATCASDRLFVEQPPLLTQVVGEQEEIIADALGDYVATLAHERALLLNRYHLVDVAFRVVGVGSVGNRTYIALLEGNGPQDTLVLQIKQARPGVFTGYEGFDGTGGHQGRRVVLGQKAMQTTHDALLGWTRIGADDYYVRTFRDMKGSIDPSCLPGHQLDDYARLTGALLARAHARTADARVLTGYLGRGDAADTALVTYAHAYADQTEADHAALVAAVAAGRIPAEHQD
ncbi:MAG: hypothetical protein QG608_2550 [Actinomycetota bacterium]|nr:hypothetical protein [Actinomycetota bacterium]MDQ1294665.1 hypothetical protein [Actinomycetota bacterium]